MVERLCDPVTEGGCLGRKAVCLNSFLFTDGGELDKVVVVLDEEAEDADSGEKSVELLDVVDDELGLRTCTQGVCDALVFLVLLVSGLCLVKIVEEVYTLGVLLALFDFFNK